MPLALVPATLLALTAASVTALTGTPSQAATVDPTSTPASQSGTATPTSTTRPVFCPSPLISSAGGGIDTGAQTSLMAGFDTPVEPRDYTFSLVRTSPTPVAVVREVQAASGTAFTLRLGETHRFAVEVSAPDCTRHRFFLTLPVRPSLTIGAVRNAPRDYTFSGRVLPGRGQTVGLFRVTDTGQRVFTADAVVGPDGTYTVRRRFTGSGRFGFEVRVVDSDTNLAGASRVRPTLVH